MKRRVFALLICSVMVFVAVCQSYAADPSLQSIYSMVKQILQQVTSNQQQVISIQTQLTSMQTQLSSIQTQIASGQTKVDGLSTQVDGLSTQVDALSDKFDLGVTVTPRSYYLTLDRVAANQAITACDPGFHMASYWEILDPTTLRYDISRSNALRPWLGDDWLHGPPSDIPGWVSTGNLDGTWLSTAGTANCGSWTKTDHSEYGTVVRLLEEWQHEIPIDTSTNRFTEFVPSWWLPGVDYCDSTNHVWCVQD